MSDQNTTVTAPETNGTTKAKKDAKVLFPTMDEAKAAGGTDKQRIYEIVEAGSVVGYTWANGVNDALAVAAKVAGFSAGVAETKTGGPVTKEKVASRLADFTDEELAALGLSRKKPKTQKV